MAFFLISFVPGTLVNLQRMKSTMESERNYNNLTLFNNMEKCCSGVCCSFTQQPQRAKHHGPDPLAHRARGKCAVKIFRICSPSTFSHSNWFRDEKFIFYCDRTEIDSARSSLAFSEIVLRASVAGWTENNETIFGDMCTRLTIIF